MRSSGKVGITDVAKHAGVSLATVSRAMNGNTTVDPALAERVRASAAELGYTANPLARSLVLGRTQTIAVVIPDLGNPTFQSILRGLSRAAALDGYHVLIADSAEQVDEERLLATQTRDRTDGLVLCAPRMPQAELDALIERIAPVVVINRTSTTSAPTVAADYHSALSELIEHLYTLGHRHVAYLFGVTRSASNPARVLALDEALLAHADLTVTHIEAGVDFDSGAAVAEAVAASAVTAVLAFNDLVAMGLLSTLTDRGVNVPEDISIVGFDDIPFARYTMPPLTTASVPSAQIGALAWQAMHAQLTGTDTPSVSVTLAADVVIRSSTAPPRLAQ